MYPAEIVKPMKDELINIGFQELLSPDAVDNGLSKPGTTLIVVNSVCGRAAQPAVRLSLKNETPDNLYTVFAGVDKDATDMPRKNDTIPTSSPSLALFKDGELVHI